MVGFSGLPFELQTDIWTMVLPSCGGVHWVEFEGFPHESHIIKESLQWTHDLFNDREPTVREYNYGNWSHEGFVRFCESLNQSSQFFKYLYTIVPSVYGKSREGQDELTQEIRTEIASTRRCRQLSTYSQVATLLSTCQTSRLAALDYLSKMVPNGSLPIYRGSGPLYRPRHLNIWKHQYHDIKSVREGVDMLLPTIYGPLDLVVFRLHTTFGYPKEILKHAYYQLSNCGGSGPSLPDFHRIGIEWHSLWDTEEGKKELRIDAIQDILSLTCDHQKPASAQLYWLVEGVPRPQWDKYPPAIPAAFSRIIERRKGHLLEHWQTDQARKDQFLKHHDLYQEFEAVGRRYYIVFVIAHWTHELHLEKSFLDPDISWDGPFPGGEDIWPEPLRGAVRVTHREQWTMPIDRFCSYVLSWEPI